jgi:predicted metal-dependent peptidase
MSPVSLSRYRVSFIDHDVYDIVVEAVSEAAAIKKARRIYNLNGDASGNSYPESWTTEPLVQEVQP